MCAESYCDAEIEWAIFVVVGKQLTVVSPIHCIEVWVKRHCIEVSK